MKKKTVLVMNINNQRVSLKEIAVTLSSPYSKSLSVL